MKSSLTFGLGVTALFGVIPTLPAQDLTFHSSASNASLVELYSSEGCSSCPPAESWLNHLKSSPDLWKSVFPAAFHVDYWDGLGWPDRFARAEYTERQRSYAARLGQDSVYTPEFIVNGHEWRRGWISDSFPAENTGKSGDLSVAVSTTDRKFSATYHSTAGDLTLNVALLGFNVISDVKRGENGGRTLHHDFVVLGFTSMPLPQGDGNRAVSAAWPATHDEAPGAIIAWVSHRDGSIRQITGGWLQAPK